MKKPPRCTDAGGGRLALQGSPVARLQLDVFQGGSRLVLLLRLLSARGQVGVEVGLLDADAAALSLSPEAEMRKQALAAPIVDEAIGNAGSFGGLLRRKH